MYFIMLRVYSWKAYDTELGSFFFISGVTEITPYSPGDSTLQQTKQTSYFKRHREQHESSKIMVWLSLLLILYNVSETPFAIISAKSLQSWNIFRLYCTFFLSLWQILILMKWTISFHFLSFGCLNIKLIWIQLPLNWAEINRILFYGFLECIINMAVDKIGSLEWFLWQRFQKSTFLLWKINCKSMNDSL